MTKFFAKPYRWAVIISILLLCSSAYVLLDAFVIPKAVTQVKTEASTQTTGTSEAQTEAVVSDTAYKDNNIKITIQTVRKDDTTLYVADIKVSDASYLKTALADNSFGRNINATTSVMAKAHQAIFAINGDYYGFRNDGYVLRNGVLYRDTARNAGDDQALVIDKQGNLSIIHEHEVTADSLVSQGAWQVLSFGPALVENGEISVDSSSEVSQSMRSNPRTAIGQISALHYIVIVADGRSSESQGLSLLELAQEFAERGCTIAYNLDGGGSSTMYFNGQVINNPSDGRSTSEREVSDIVYIGY